jgi:hypothetical protein
MHRGGCAVPAAAQLFSFANMSLTFDNNKKKSGACGAGVSLQEWSCYAVASDGEAVFLRNICAFTLDGAEQCAKRHLLLMTRLQRDWLRLTKRSRVFVEPRLV